MNRKIQQMIREIEQRGGIVGIRDDVPPHVAEQILQKFLDCPCCVRGAQPMPFERLVMETMPIDVRLAGTRGHS